MAMSFSTSESPSQHERLLYVPVADLNLSPQAPPSGGAFAELVESIRTYGVLQPLLVRPGGSGYEVVAGFKRLAAAKEAGLGEVPVRVFRVEDEALSGLYEASNVKTSSRLRVAVPPVREYKPGAKLGGLLEEELNHSPGDMPYKAILTIAAILIFLIWGGLSLRNGLPRFAKDSSSSQPSGTDVPATTLPASDISKSQPVVPAAPLRVSVARWKLLFSDLEGVSVRNEGGVPRIVFEQPVFSRLTTVDKAQKERLKEVVRIVMQTNPSAVLSIIGHTDNDPIRPSSEYRSNEYLSELRANSVVDYLKETNMVASSKLRAVAAGAEDPPFPNDTAASKVKNRTVTIEIMQPGS